MKDTKVLHGNTVQELAKEYGWSPNNGYYTVRTWKGTQAEIENLIPVIVASGYEYQVREGPLWTLIAKTPQSTDDDGNPNPEVPIPIFELVSQRIDKPLLESQAYFVADLPPTTIQRIREAIRDDAGPSFLTGSFAYLGERERAADVYLHWLAGIQTVPYYVPVLRKTYTVSNQYIVNESMTVNRVYSTSTLISVENIPAMMQNILPTSALVPGTSTPFYGSSIPIVWGWLKGNPQYNQIGAAQFQVTVDYEYGGWPYKIYGDML